MFSFLVGLDKLKQRRVINRVNPLNVPQQPSSAIPQYTIQIAKSRTLPLPTPRSQPQPQPQFQFRAQQTRYLPRRTWSMEIGTASGRCSCG